MPQGPLGERIPFEGVLNCWNDDHDLPDLLLAISRSGKTGRLHFSNPEGDKTLDLRDGKIVFAESSSQDDGLGQFLLRTGEISLMDYTRVSKMVQPGKRLGALLVEQHVLHEDSLTPAVVGQVRSIVLGLFRRTESWYRFKEEELGPKETITLDLAVPELVLEGVSYVESWRRISKGVGNLESVYQQAAPYEKEWLSSTLSAEIRELISMLASPTSLAEICEHASVPDFEACRYLWALRSLGWIDLVESAAQVATTTPVATETPALAPPVAAPPEPPTPTPIPESLVATQQSVGPDTAATPGLESPPTESSPPTPTPIPEHLIETQVSVTPPNELDKITTAPSLSAPPPKPLPDHLNQTQLSLDPPPESPTARPKAIPQDLLHTQIFEDPVSPEPPPIEQDPDLPGSTGEFMESILEDEPPPAGKPAPPEPAVPTPTAAPPVSTSANHATTQFFTGPSALPPPEEAPAVDSKPSPPPPPAMPPEPNRATTAPETPSGFEALALGDDLAPPSSPSIAAKPSTAPNPADVATQPSVRPEATPDSGMASFSDLALSNDGFDAPTPPPNEPETPLPLVEADAVAVEPTPEPQYVPDEPLLPRSRGMEITQESLIPPRRRILDVDADSDALGEALGLDKK